MSDGSKLKLESDLDVNARMRTEIDINKCARVRSKDECKCELTPSQRHRSDIYLSIIKLT